MYVHRDASTSFLEFMLITIVCNTMVHKLTTARTHQRLRVVLSNVRVFEPVAYEGRRASSANVL